MVVDVDTCTKYNVRVCVLSDCVCCVVFCVQRLDGESDMI